MSWGFGTTFSNIQGGVYRTDPWTGTTRRTEFGMVGVEVAAGIFRFDVRVDAVDVDVEEMIDEGIHICIAAGNSFQKIDAPDGIDYDNYFIQNFFGDLIDRFYHRGGSPAHPIAMTVGSADSVVFNSTTEQKSTFSNCGAGVDLYAPGSRIISATSTVNSFNGADYYLNSNFKQASISGTSMASPQVCGVGALLLQLNPKLTPQQLKQRILNLSTNVVYTTGLDNDYTDNRSISNGIPRFLYHKFSGAQPYSSQNLSISNPTLRIK
jgi:subtilisin family serine protease